VGGEGMIKEIVDFMDANEGIEEYFIQDEPSATYEHFYIKILEENDSIVIDDTKSIFWIYDNLESKEKEFIKYMTYYQKALFNKALDRIHGLKGSNPYILTINIDFDGTNFTSDINDSKEPKNREKYFFNRIEKHFNDAKTYGIQQDKLEKLKQCLLDSLEQTIYTNQFFTQYIEQRKAKKDSVSISLRIYIDFGNYDTKQARDFNTVYLKDSVFLSSDKKYSKYGTCSVCAIEDDVSLPSFLNTFGTKTFEMKPTMPLDLTTFVCKACSVKLYKFKVMTDKNQLTKPFPLFIDNRSLFGQQVAVLNDNERKRSYKEILKAVLKVNPKDLKNFYLINYYSNWNNDRKIYELEIRDLDYVENFEYMTKFKVSNFMVLKNSLKLADFYEKEVSVFQFEKIINELVFENTLQYNYFSDYKDIDITYSKIDSKNSNSLLKNYLIKYRQNFYDFIYKSYQSSLDNIEFREMILDIIKDNIKHDKAKKSKDEKYYSIYENEILEKLNLLFSIKHHFKKGDQKVEQGEFVKLKEKMNSSLGCWQDTKDKDGKPILKEDKTPQKEFIDGVDYIENDDRFFAFLCGQVSRFLIGKKKGKEENKSHSDFSAFTDWQTSKLLKEYICEVHRKYAHTLKFNKRYDNAMSIILSYKDDLNMDNVMEYMMVGYFADNQIKYQNNQTQENENE
jgi:CRISPR-associated protein Csh1